MMYQYAEKYEQNIQKLIEFYISKEETYKFEPKLNSKSLKMANESQNNFFDKALNLYINKQKERIKNLS